MPSTQTIRNGTARSGTMPQKVIPPARKGWRSAADSSVARSMSRTAGQEIRRSSASARARVQLSAVSKRANTPRRLSTARCSSGASAAGRISASSIALSRVCHWAGVADCANASAVSARVRSKRQSLPRAAVMPPSRSAHGATPAVSVSSSDWATPSSSRSRPKRQLFCSNAPAPSASRWRASRPQRMPAAPTQSVIASSSPADRPKRRMTAGTASRSSRVLACQRDSGRSSRADTQVTIGCAAERARSASPNGR